MTKPVRLDAAAERDVQEAYDWYDSRQAGLGERFLANLATALERIEGAPAACSPVDGSFSVMVRSLGVGPFPYRVVFIELPDRCRGVAVVHSGSDPEHVRARLEGRRP